MSSAWRWVRYSTAISEKPTGVHRPDRTTGPAHPGLEHIHTADQAVDLFGDEQRLVKRIGRRQQPHPFPLAALCLQTGRGLARKAGQDRKRRADNRRGGPIVPEKGDLPKRRPFLPQPVETAGVGTTESINRLIRIPDDEEALPSPAPCPDEPELNGIDILELVDEQMGEPAGSGSPLLRLQLPKQQIVEIQHRQILQPLRIGIVKKGIWPGLPSFSHPSKPLFRAETAWRASRTESFSPNSSRISNAMATASS